MPKTNGDGSVITVDSRTGSDRLGKLLLRRRQPVDMGQLQFGDVAFLGHGPEGRPISVGIEYKTVSDALKCMIDGRFAGHQLIGLTQSYDVVILLVEGEIQPDPRDGMLKVRHDRGFWYNGKIGQRVFMYREFDHWLMTLTFKAGVRVLRSSNLDASAATVIDLFNWWTAKDWADHRSHLALAMTDEFRDDANMVKPNLVRRVAKEFKGIGWTRSAAVARKFRTVFDLCMADEGDWATIDGIGKPTAKQVVAAIRGDKL